jgi:hypothetical protein
MKYRVTFLKVADQELADIWLNAADRTAVTIASFQLQQLLELRPLKAGESRGSSVNRTVINPPLAFDYEVIEDDKKVRVVHVWTI